MANNFHSSIKVKKKKKKKYGFQYWEVGGNSGVNAGSVEYISTGHM